MQYTYTHKYILQSSPRIKTNIIIIFFHTSRTTKSDSDMTDKTNKNGTEMTPQIVSNDDQGAQ